MGREKVTSTLVVSGTKIEYKADKDKGIYVFLPKDEKGKGRPKADIVLPIVKGQAAGKTVHNWYTAKLKGEGDIAGARQPLKPGERIEKPQALEGEEEEEEGTLVHDFFFDDLLDLHCIVAAMDNTKNATMEGFCIPDYSGGKISWYVAGGNDLDHQTPSMKVHNGNVYRAGTEQKDYYLFNRVEKMTLPTWELVSTLEEWRESYYNDILSPEFDRLWGRLAGYFDCLSEKDRREVLKAVKSLPTFRKYIFYRIFRERKEQTNLTFQAWLSKGQPCPFGGDLLPPESKQRRFYANYCKFIGKTNEGATLPTFEEWKASGSPTAHQAGYKFVDYDYQNTQSRYSKKASQAAKEKTEWQN